MRTLRHTNLAIDATLYCLLGPGIIRYEAGSASRIVVGIQLPGPQVSVSAL
jgi:hypothetical protein